MDHLFFSLFSILIVAPLIPLLSEVGIAICPIMRTHGFLYGCSLNVLFIGKLLMIQMIAGNLSIYAEKKLRLPNLLKVESSVLLNGAFLLTSFLGLYWFQDSSKNAIVHAGSPYSVQIMTILWSAGSAVIFLNSVVLDYFLVRQKKIMVDFDSRWTTLWNKFVLVVPPAIVLSGFFYFSLLLLDSEIEGWASLEQQKTKLMTASLFFIGWYAVYSLISSVPRRQVLARLIAGANALRTAWERPTAEITMSRTGEFAPVAEALNRSRNVLVERARLISSFSKFVSDRLIEQILNVDETSIQGSQVQAVIMMTDLRDFTKMSEKLEPTQVVKLLNIYFEDMIGILHEQDLIVDKFIGDGLLAYQTVTAGRTKEQCCEAAISSATKMLGFLSATNGKLKREGLPEIQVGIGIYFGEVVLGAVGSKSRLQYTIIGDAVNRTARIEGLCKELDSPLILSSNVYQPSQQPNFEGPFSVKLKGIKDDINVFKWISHETSKVA